MVVALSIAAGGLAWATGSTSWQDAVVLAGVSIASLLSFTGLFWLAYERPWTARSRRRARRCGNCGHRAREHENRDGHCTERVDVGEPWVDPTGEKHGQPWTFCSCPGWADPTDGKANTGWRAG